MWRRVLPCPPCIDFNETPYDNTSQNVTGVPADDQILVYSGKMLHDAQTLRQAGVLSHSTLHVSARLRGGKPVKVKMMTNHLPCGPEVTIDIEPEASKDEIKQKLAVATGVPVEHQKVMLSGINQIVMGDKRWGHNVICQEIFMKDRQT